MRGIPGVSCDQPLPPSRRCGPWCGILLVAVAASRLLYLAPLPQDLLEVRVAAGALGVQATGTASPAEALWQLLASLGLWLHGDPFMVLRLLCVAASVATVAVLARLWSAAVAGATAAAWAAALYAVLPAAWFHAGRPSSATLVLFLSVAACAVWLHRGRWAGAGGAVLLGSAIAVGGQWTPVLAIVLLAALDLRRERVAGLAVAGTAVAAGVVVGLVPAIVYAGGGAALRSWVASATGVASGQAAVSGIGWVWAFGPPWCLLLVVPAGWGWVKLRRRSPRAAWWWLVLVVATVSWLMVPALRGRPGAALPLAALVCGPWVAGLVQLVRPRIGNAVTAAIVACAAAWTLPAVREQAVYQAPELAALAEAQRSDTVRTVLYDERLQPHVDLLRNARRAPLALVPLAEVPVRLGPRRPLRGPWAMVWKGEPPPGWVAPAFPPPRRFGRAPAARASRLDPGDEPAWLALDGALVLEPPDPVRNPGGGVPVARQRSLKLMLQPVADGSQVSVRLGIEGGRAVMRLACWPAPALQARLAEGEHTLHVPSEELLGSPAPSRPAVVRLSRVRGGVGRAQLLRIWVDEAGGSAPRRLTARAQASGVNGLVSGEGFHGVERLGTPPAEGRWARATARLSLPAGCSRIVVDLCAPRPQPARVTLSAEAVGWSRELEVGPAWQQVVVPIPEPLARVELGISVANPFVPARDLPAAGDRRELGVVVGEVRFE